MDLDSLNIIQLSLAQVVNLDDLSSIQTLILNNKFYLDTFKALFTNQSMNQPNYFMQKFMEKMNWLTQIIGRQNLAVLFMFSSTLIWPVSFIYVNQHKISPFQTYLARGIAIFITHTLLCRLMGLDLDFKSTHDFKYLVIRNTAMLFHQLCYAGMHFVVSLPVNNTILMSGPLFVFLIDYYLNGITINKKQAVGIVLGIMGVILTVNGQYFMSLLDGNYQSESSFEHYLVEDTRIKLLLSFITILSNAVWAYGIVMQKKIKHVPGIKISYFLGLEFLFSSSIAYSFGSVKQTDSSTFFGAFIFSGCGMAISQIFFNSSLNMTKHSGKLTILLLNNVLISTLISFFRYGEPINTICICGIIMMAYGLGRTVFSKDG